MKEMTAREIAYALDGKLLSGDPEKAFSAVSTDTRTIPAGALFVALRGERFDAHNFLGEALGKGAGGLIVAEEFRGAAVPVIQVPDTLFALQDLARYNRLQFRLPVVAITGSNGKTTTKDMVSAVLGTKYKVLKTEGNLNNEIGLPLTLLQLDQLHGAVVVEMGMRGLGEIDLLARIAEPTVGLITNIGETHLERLGSVENIAQAKGELLDHIPESGLAILNGADERVLGQAARCKGKVIFYGTLEDSQLRAYEIYPVGEEGTAFKCAGMGIDETFYIPVLGEHNVLNALAAIAVGLSLGVPVADISCGLRQLKLTSMRLEVINTANRTVINDAYNANPASTKAALGVLENVAKARRRVAVLGNMYELGERTAAGHRETGAEAAARGVEALVTVGELARDIARGAMAAGLPAGQVHAVETNDEALEVLHQILRDGDVILVKGSRGMKMEEIVQALID